MTHSCCVTHNKQIASLGTESFKLEVRCLGRLTRLVSNEVLCALPPLITSVTSAIFKAELKFLMLSVNYTSLPAIATLSHQCHLHLPFYNLIRCSFFTGHHSGVGRWLMKHSLEFSICCSILPIQASQGMCFLLKHYTSGMQKTFSILCSSLHDVALICHI